MEKRIRCVTKTYPNKYNIGEIRRNDQFATYRQEGKSAIWHNTFMEKIL